MQTVITQGLNKVYLLLNFHQKLFKNDTPSGQGIWLGINHYITQSQFCVIHDKNLSFLFGKLSQEVSEVTKLQLIIFQGIMHIIWHNLVLKY